jgi:MinD superfamily P-loop ATPase
MIKELVCISGKGGTGKTSMVASFAALAQNHVLADCDVDAPDLHLVLNPHIIHTEDFSGGMRARIDQGVCKASGKCRDMCRFGAVRRIVKDGQVSFKIDPIACEGCGVCVFFCPANAILLEEAINGKWFISDTRYCPMVHASLGVAEENSGKLVSLVKTEARKVAEKTGRELIIVDGPPGIGCPVIASLSGADLALVITEPTMSGLHDLKRVAELAGRFNLPVAVCLNKSDINPILSMDIEEWCKKKGIEIAGSIPYDHEFTRAQIQGKSLVEFSQGPAAEAVKKLWKKVEDFLRDYHIKSI